MDDRRLADLARRQGGVVSAAQLQACGLTRSGIRHRVAAHRLFAVCRGVYALSPHWDRRAAMWAAVLATSMERASISHWSAAEIHGMAAPRPFPVHVTIPGAGGRNVRGIEVHGGRALRSEDVVTLDGLRVTAPGRTVIDIAATADDRRVGRLIREAEYLGLLPTGAMARVVTANPRHPGAARVRRVDPETATDRLRQTPLEDELEAFIAGLPLPTPDPQVPLGGTSGASYLLDFGWPAIRLAAEADGRSAHERASSLDSDRFRDNDLAGIGWLTMRFTRLQLTRGRADSARQLLAAAMTRGWSPTAT